MDSRRSELTDVVIVLKDAARRGDWQQATRLLATLAQSTPPSDVRALGEYLASLREALIAAKISRSHLAANLHRVRAAASFGSARQLPPERRHFGGLTGS